MSAMARLRPPVDAFFYEVRVNGDGPMVREDRLKLLNEIATPRVRCVVFSEIQD